MKNKKTYIVLIISMLLWGGSFVWSKIALETYPPITIVVFRLIISVIAIFIFAKITKLPIVLNRKDLKLFLIMAFFEPFMYFIGETYGLQKLSATTTSVIISTIPIFIPIFIFLIYKEKLSLLNFIGSIISFIGILIIILNKNFSLDFSLSGILLIFLAVFSAIGYSLIVKNIAERYNPILIVLFQNIIAVILFLPLFFIVDFSTITTIKHNLNSILAIAKLGIFASSIAFILFAFGIKKIGVSKASFFTNLIPIFTSIIAFFLLGEKLSFIKYIGIAIVVLGLFLSQIKGTTNIIKITKKL